MTTPSTPVSPTIDPTHPVVLVSAGRSGSTLLQRCLNLHPDLTMWGEHAGLLSAMMTAHNRVVHEANNAELLARGYGQRNDVIGPLADRDAFIAWASPFSADDFAGELREFILHLFRAGLGPNVRWGFKEIRYARPVLEFVHEMFDQAQYIVLYRDPRAQVRSRCLTFEDPNRFFGDDDDALRDTVNQFFVDWVERYRSFAAFGDAHPDATHVISFEDFTSHPELVSDLFAWLELDSPPRPDIEDVLARSAGASANVTRWDSDQVDRLESVLDAASSSQARALFDRLQLRSPV